MYTFLKCISDYAVYNVFQNILLRIKWSFHQIIYLYWGTKRKHGCRKKLPDHKTISL